MGLGRMMYAGVMYGEDAGKVPTGALEAPRVFPFAMFFVLFVCLS